MLGFTGINDHQLLSSKE